MEALDTFRIPPYRHNCAQAVANRWKHLYANDDVVDRFAPFVGGRAPKGYCGALYAAIEACPTHAENIMREFECTCGDTYCRTIKSRTHTPCETCVRTADMLVAKYSRV